MKMQDIITEMIKHPEYFTESTELIPVGIRQKRTHHKYRINKKWLKRYGTETIYEEHKCKKFDVTIDSIVQFCIDQNLPLPDEFLNQEENV